MPRQHRGNRYHVFAGYTAFGHVTRNPGKLKGFCRFAVSDVLSCYPGVSDGSGLKIRVSVVRFRPWAPRNPFIIKDL